MSKSEKTQFRTEYIRMFGEKAWKERNKERRVINGFNTGSRTMKSNKDYSRSKGRQICRRYL